MRRGRGTRIESVFAVGMAMVFALSCGGGASSVPDGGAGAGAPGGHAGSTGGHAGSGQAGASGDGGAAGFAGNGAAGTAGSAAGGTTGGGGGGAGRAGAGGGQVGGGGDGGSAVDGGSPDGATANVAAPRLIAPLSTATVTSRRPTLHWLLAAGSDGAHVQICRDRACATPVASFDATGSTGAPANNLPTGALFWRAYGRSGATTGPVSTPVWQFTVGTRSAAIDTSWGTTLDVNGDGYPDVIVGDNDATGSNNRADAGRVYVYMGSASGLATTPALTLVGPDTASAFFGSAIASAGDVNGDGYADVVVGAYGYSSLRGGVYLYLGGPNGLESTVATAAVGPLPSSYFGSAVTSAGDVNGDGYADVVVGAYQKDRAYIFFGSANGIGTAPSETLVGPDIGSGFGDAVASVGDLNGDGYADVVVGTPAYGATGETGRVDVYYGSAAGVPTAPSITLAAQESDDHLGLSVAGTDVNGDGYADLLVAAMGENRFFVYFGGESGLASVPDQTLIGPSGTASQDFPLPVSAAGDVNGDGYSDVIVGAQGIQSAFVYLGSATGLGPLPASPTLTKPNGEDFGNAAAGVGDVNGDGYADVMVSAATLESVFLYDGSAAGLASSPAVTLTGPSGSLQFGVALAR